MKIFEAATPEGRKTAIIMLLLTSVYLVFELGFNARLLDVVGANASHDEVENIENYGRYISGVATTLVFWNFQIKNALSAQASAIKVLISLLLSATLSVVGMYYFQKILVDFLTDHTAADTRARAALLVPISHLIKSNDFKLAQLDLKPEAFESPEGKTFIATFALQALAVPKLFDKVAPQADGVFRMTVVQRRGQETESYAEFQKSASALKTKYVSDYSVGNRAYNDALNNIPIQQRDSWTDYKNSLTYRGAYGGVKRIEPNRVPAGKWAEVRHSVRSKGIEVSNDWRPDDQVSFYRAIDRKVRSQARNEFEQKSKNSLGSGVGLEPNLTFDQWVNSAAIQQQWRETLRVPAKTRLNPSMTLADYSARVYEPAVVADVLQIKNERLAPVAQYADGRKFENVGKDNARALIVPPIALTFSLIGAFLHILKCCLFVAKLFVSFSLTMFWGVFFGYLALVLVIPFAFPNQVTQQPLITTLARHTETALGPFFGGGLNNASHWVMLMQKYFYVVNENVRVRVLHGFTYGYEGGEVQRVPEGKLGTP